VTRDWAGRLTIARICPHCNAMIIITLNDDDPELPDGIFDCGAMSA
jgi:hypothetical protein